MIKIFFISIVLLLVNVCNFTYAQFEVFLPSEKEYVTGDYYDDWVVTDNNEYSGKYEYFKNEYETKVYDAFLIIKSTNNNITLELNEKINNGEMQSINEIIAINAEGFQTGLRSGSFRKLFYKDKRGNKKISYQLRFNGDCCDGACDDYFERTEILSENKGMGVRDDFGFQILGKSISFNISESELITTYPNLTIQKSENINKLIYYSLEESSESSFFFLNLTFSFFDGELYEINIQNNSNELVGNEINSLTNSFTRVEEIENVIDPGYINVPTVVFRKDNLKIQLTDVHFTFCTITNEMIEKKLRDLHPDYFNNK